MEQRRDFSRLTLVLVITLLLVTSRPTQAQVARQVAQKAFPSVVLLVMEDSNGQPLSLGSGFLVRDGVVATSLHVIEGAAKGYVKFIGKDTKHDIAGTVALDNRRDLVLLSVTGARGPLLTLGEAHQVQVGDEIYAVGNPQGLEGTLSQGIISGIRQVGSETVFQITAPISPGSSGGPVLNARGKVIGIAAATFRGGQNLNFAIPVSYLVSMVSNIGSPVPLAARESVRQGKSVLSDLGTESVEGVAAEAFDWDLCCTGYYSFSLRNRLSEAIRNVRCLVVFYDLSNLPIDYDVVEHSGTIPARLAKRIKGNVDASVQMRLVENSFQKGEKGGKVEFRVLDFQIVQ